MNYVEYEQQYQKNSDLLFLIQYLIKKNNDTIVYSLYSC